ncbi:MAG: hypothetical protein QM767_18585 [Anaeromyxobacter sp.]
MPRSKAHFPVSMAGPSNSSPQTTPAGALLTARTAGWEVTLPAAFRTTTV